MDATHHTVCARSHYMASGFIHRPYSPFMDGDLPDCSALDIALRSFSGTVALQLEITFDGAGYWVTAAKHKPLISRLTKQLCACLLACAKVPHTVARLSYLPPLLGSAVITPPSYPLPAW